MQQQQQQQEPPPPQQQQHDDQRRKPMRRMSHVEDWIEIDSKESLPDEEELERPFTDFFIQVLPLHSPPPSLSNPGKNEMATDIQMLDDDDDEDLEERGRDGPFLHGWKSDGEDDDDDSRGMPIPPPSSGDNHDAGAAARTLVRRHSISSFSNAVNPSISTSASHAMSTSPPSPPPSREDIRWAQTIARLRRSLIPAKKKGLPPDGFIPMPPAPRRPTASQHHRRRRSEATTQPRFNPDTNTYTRDTRSNPDHLRIIACELNMIRSRKLLSPLKPRGFLPRRKDPFVRGEHRRVSALQHEWLPPPSPL
ncbi:hypothetical protein BX666DRAFT_1954646 [Dichotomocladium elegans]|nr:hypothetical protein BX666DRAFT_1954646 [Dichotomocladium elegans]